MKFNGSTFRNLNIKSLHMGVHVDALQSQSYKLESSVYTLPF